MSIDSLNQPSINFLIDILINTQPTLGWHLINISLDSYLIISWVSWPTHMYRATLDDITVKISQLSTGWWWICWSSVEQVSAKLLIKCPLSSDESRPWAKGVLGAGFVLLAFVAFLFSLFFFSFFSLTQNKEGRVSWVPPLDLLLLRLDLGI